MEQKYEYEKIVDDVYWIGFNISLRFSVVLARANDNGYRKSFYQEYQYESNKYKDQRNLITVKRQYDYFLSIENIKEIDGIKEYIIIGVSDFPYFRQKILEASRWLSDSNLYRYKENNIIMVGSVKPIVINFMAWNKTITLEPIVMKNEQNINCAGIRMTLGKNKENFCDISVDRYMGFAYIIESFNMHLVATNMLTFMQKPENISVNHITTSYTSKKRTTNGKPGRFVGNISEPSLEDL